MFHKIIYDDESKHLKMLLEELEDHKLKNTFVKIVISNKNNSYWFDQFIENLVQRGVSDIQVVEDHYNLNIDDEDEILEQAEDTITIINKYIDSMPEDVDKNKLQNSK